MNAESAEAQSFYLLVLLSEAEGGEMNAETAETKGRRAFSLRVILSEVEVNAVTLRLRSAEFFIFDAQCPPERSRRREMNAVAQRLENA
jgi:hypothetical protein